MASRHSNDHENSVEEDEDDVEIFSLSGWRKGGSFRRGAQTSHFGAVDEEIELQIYNNTNGDQREQLKTNIEQKAKLKQRNHPELVSSSYQTEHGTNPSGSQERTEELEEAVETLIELIGFGKFQLLMLAVCGCGLFHASIQLGFVGYLMPDIARELCLSDASTGWLRGSVFIGVIFVSILWGCAADLRCRRFALGVCLAITGTVTAMAACFSQRHSALMVFLIISSLGTGGVISISFVFVSEFVPRRTGIKMTCALLTFTVLGAMFVSVITTVFASNLTGEDLSAGDFSRNPFANWRIFCLVTSLLPMLSLIVVLSILPGSPYLLLEQRRWTKAIKVLTQLYSYNNGEAGLEMFKDRANGLYLLKRHTQDRQSHAPSTHLQICARGLYLGIKNVTSVLDTRTLILVISGFTFAFGGVAYAGSSFKECSFHNVLSEATSFRQCIFVDTIFENTDLQSWQFSDSEFVNSTFRGVGRGCTVDVPFAPATAYLQIMFGHSGGLLGLILSVFISKLIETRLLFMYGTLVTAVTILFGFFPVMGWTAAIRLFVLQFGGFAASSALIVQAMMSFPTHKRASGLCLLLSVITTGGLLGFMAVVTLPQVADVIVTALLLIVSAVCSCFFQRHPYPTE